MLRRLHLFALTLLGTWLIGASALAQPLPVLERIEPTSGPTGTLVQLVGRAFDGSTRAFLGMRECEVVQRLPNRWTIRIPANGTTAPIFLRNTSGQSTAFPFTITAAPPPPTVERFDPTSGAPGSQVTIYGQNFSTRLTENLVSLGQIPLVVRQATPFALTVIVPDGAVSGPFSVRVGAAGTATSATPFDVTVQTAIASFAPAFGAPGSRITITGTGFSPRANENRVFLNSVPVRVEQATPTSLVVSIPQRASTGHFDIDVRNGGRARSATPFGLQFPPSIVAVEPPAGPIGTVVTIRGTNFGSDIRLIDARLGDRPLVLRGLSNGTEVQAEVPAETASNRIAVTVNGLGPAVSARDFTVLPSIALTSFSPSQGPIGSSVTITGSGFSPNPRENTVTFAGVRGEVTSASPTALVVRTPNAPSGSIDVAVRFNGTVRSLTPFIVTRPPVVTGFAPARLTVNENVVISGSNFGTNPQNVEVSINGRPLTVASVGDNQIVAVVPHGATSGRLVVTIVLQGSSTTGRMLEVVQPFTASSVEPVVGYVGTVVRVLGAGFTTGARVVFAPNVSAPATVVSATELTTVVPQGAQSGPLAILLTDGRRVDLAAFSVQELPSGIGITAVTPMCTRPGCFVQLSGYGFAPRANQNRVFFGDIAVRVSQASATMLTVTLPNRPNTANTFRVNVRNVGEAVSQPFAITQ
jgi:hypothetical protein